jgi:hypothetical protein
MDSDTQNGSGGNATKIWIGIAIGTAIGVGIALSRRKPTRWESAKDVAMRISDRSGDLAGVTRDIVDHIKNIYEESRKVVDEASGLWQHSRKMVGV